MTSRATDDELEILEPIIGALLELLDPHIMAPTFRRALDHGAHIRTIVVPAVDVDVIGLARLVRDYGGAGAKVIEVERVELMIDNFSQAARDVLAERRRQISEEGWTPEHDDEHADGSLARAAACYASPDDMSYTDNFGRELDRERRPRPLSQREQLLSWSYVRALRWPWVWEWWKRKDQRRDLVRAGALIIAEIERLDRAKARRVEGRAS